LLSGLFSSLLSEKNGRVETKGLSFDTGVRIPRDQHKRVILEELKKSLLPGVFSTNRRLIGQ